MRDVEVMRETLPGEYNLDHLKRFHRQLFRDVYDWAGESRCVDISKPGAQFCHWRYIDDEVSGVLGGLAGEDLLMGLKQGPFVERLAHYYGETNARHPFREGNGRTQRAFFRQLAASAGWRIDWSELTQEENIRACRDNFVTGSTDSLIKMLEPMVSHL